MTFEVEPTRVGGRRQRWSALVVGAVGLTLVLAAVAGAVFATRPASVATAGLPEVSPSPASAPVDALGAPITGAPAAGRPGARARPPATIACHGLPRTACVDAVDAAVAILPAGLPPIRTAGAWSSLLCGDTLDCPLGSLSGSDPVGSVVLTFEGGGPSAMINVVRPEALPGARLPIPLQAWLARWSG